MKTNHKTTVIHFHNLVDDRLIFKIDVTVTWGTLDQIQGCVLYALTISKNLICINVVRVMYEYQKPYMKCQSNLAL